MQDNIDNNNIEVVQPKIEKKKREYVFTEKRKLALEKMQAARKLKLEERKKTKCVVPEEMQAVPILERSKPIINESSSSDTDSENYESDKESNPVIISGYDENEPESKIKITKVKRRNAICVNKDLEKIYEEVKQEESKPVKKQSTRRKKILDTYYEKNKDVYTQHDGELGEIELSQDEFDELHKRFIEYEKGILMNRLVKAEPKKRKPRTKKCKSDGDVSSEAKVCENSEIIY
jgi:hypothetical protein